MNVYYGNAPQQESGKCEFCGVCRNAGEGADEKTEFRWEDFSVVVLENGVKMYLKMQGAWEDKEQEEREGEGVEAGIVEGGSGGDCKE